MSDSGRESGWNRRVKKWHASATPDQADASYTRKFDWTFRGEAITWEIDIPIDIYGYCSDRSRTSQYGLYVIDPVQQPFVESLVDRLSEFAEERSLDRSDQLFAAVRFVQSLEYVKDTENTGHDAYPKYPIETLVHGQGDCEDGSILLAALLNELEYDTVLLLLPEARHMIVGVADVAVTGASVTYNDSEYFTIETTQVGWKIGELSPKCQNSSVIVHDCEGLPLLVHEWEAMPVEPGSVTVDVHVANFGDAQADNVQVQLLFERRDGETVSQRSLSRGATLGQGASTKYDCRLSLPVDRTLRGKCRLGINGKLHDESESDWG